MKAFINYVDSIDCSDVDDFVNHHISTYGLGYHTIDGYNIRVLSDQVMFCDESFLKIHRLDGPAIYYKSEFSRTKEWYFNGIIATMNFLSWAFKNDIDLNNLTETDKALIKLVWADYGK